MINLTLKIGDEIQRTEGETIEEAAEKFRSPGIITSRGSLRIYKNGKQAAITAMPVKRLKLFFHFLPHVRERQVENLKIFLQE